MYRIHDSEHSDGVKEGIIVGKPSGFVSSANHRPMKDTCAAISFSYSAFAWVKMGISRSAEKVQKHQPGSREQGIDLLSFFFSRRDREPI